MAAPNPFNGHTAIRYELSRKSSVRVRIFDLRGALVRELAVGPRTFGSHVELWDGRTTEGRLLPSGVYFYRVNAGQVAAAGKVILMK